MPEPQTCSGVGLLKRGNSTMFSVSGDEHIHYCHQMYSCDLFEIQRSTLTALFQATDVCICVFSVSHEFHSFAEQSLADI